jgi:hypothetical protein
MGFAIGRNSNHEESNQLPDAIEKSHAPIGYNT